MIFLGRKRDDVEEHEHLSEPDDAKGLCNYGDLRCEEEIMKDKEKFGRTRTSLMKHLRARYGRDVADRALRRVNKRITEGYLNQ
ncbi:MAG: hypothetical protein KGL95_08770 [Patescibacteria group bacterium]|nr:hypothetical protein [Patescibacteria group bacterium]